MSRASPWFATTVEVLVRPIRLTALAVAVAVIVEPELICHICDAHTLTAAPRHILHSHT